MLLLRSLLVACFCVMAPRVLMAEELSQRVLRPDDLRCEYLRNPLGIDQAQPRLSWILTPANGEVRGLSQSAWEILVCDSRDGLDAAKGIAWQSGRVESAQSSLVPYGGAPLRSGVSYWWKVRVWDEQGNPSAWSAPAFWSMGLLGESDWDGAQWLGLNAGGDEVVDTADIRSAQWIWFPEGKPELDAATVPFYFRQSFDLPAERKPVRAYCLFAADSFCQFYVNGAHVGMSQGFKSLGGADILGQLKPGKNQIAARVSNGKENVPQNPGGWLAAVRIEFETGDPILVATGAGWKCSKEAPANWQAAELDDSAWAAARELGPAGMAPWGLPWGEVWQTEHRRLPARYLRREFAVDTQKAIHRATAYVCGLGFFDLYLNGHLVGDQLMNPALSGYDQRALYVTFDLGKDLRPGANAIGLVLSNGRFFAPRVSNPMPMHNYGHPRALAKIDVEYEDGTHAVVVSDPAWKLTTEGPLRASNEYDGEEYDARMEMPGWSEAGFDDIAWQPASTVEAPAGRLEAQLLEPIRVTQEIDPVQLIEAKPGVWMVDFGQAFYGVVRLQASAPAGTRVSIRTSFNRLPDGTLNYLNDRSARNTDIYTFKGEGVEVWHPRFRGNATRWAQVEGFLGTPTAENFTGLVTHTDFESAGDFACANELVNKVFQNAKWGTRMQNRSVPMEPDRDERMPWSGHPAKTSESEGWEYNVARFYDHFLHNYRVHQAEDGSLQEILPPYWKFNSKDIVWPSVATIIPDWYYNFYGDDRPLRDNYEMMKAFTLYHERANLKPDGTLDHCSYGDWVDAASMDRRGGESGATSRPLIGTAYFYNNCRIVQRAAKLLGKSEDQKYFGELAERVRAGFNKRFLDEAAGTYESDTQCAYVLALNFGLAPADRREALSNRLVEDILVRHKGHTSVGLIGMQWQMQTLTAIGHPEAAWSIITRTDRPSWGYMISKGATTSWERWDMDTQDGGMNGESQKILSGNVEAWCYQTLGGINYDPEHPGFKHIIFRPWVPEGLAWARASHQSPYGLIESAWKMESGAFEWHMVVPPNTTAAACLPVSMEREIQISGRSIREAPGVTLIRNPAGLTFLALGSGTYHLEALALPLGGGS